MIDETVHSISQAGIKLSVCSFNVRFLTKQENPQNNWENRKYLIVSHFSKKDYDIIGVQELTLPQSKYLQQEFNKLGYKYFNQPRDSPKNQQCGIFVKANKFEVTQLFCDWINETKTREIVGYDSKHARYFVSVVVTPVCNKQIADKALKKCVLISNFHLDHIGVEARQKGIEHGLQRCKLVRQKYGKNDAYKLVGCILIGDFNEPQQCPIFKVLTDQQEMKFHSMRVIQNSDKSFTFNGFKSKRLLRTGQIRVKPEWTIDHMFWWSTGKETLKPIKFKVDKGEDQKFISDHYGIVGTFFI